MEDKTKKAVKKKTVKKTPPKKKTKKNIIEVEIGGDRITRYRQNLFGKYEVFGEKRGRIIKYNPHEVLELFESYVKEREDEYESQDAEEKMNSLGQKETKKIWKLKVRMPSKLDFADYIGISRSTLYEWVDLYPEFSDMVEKISHIQEQRLKEKTLSGDYNIGAAKLIFSNDLNIREKNELEITKKSELEDLSMTDLDKLGAEISDKIKFLEEDKTPLEKLTEE